VNLTSSLCLIVCCGFVSVGAAKPQNTNPPVAGGGFTVTVDAVITDDTNRVVRNLRAEDLEIWEDGVLQTTDSLQFYGGNQGPRPAGSPVAQQSEGTSSDAATMPALPGQRLMRRLIVLLLDYGSADLAGQSLIDNACRKFIDSDVAEGDLVAVFTIDSGFRLVADFTDDKAALKKALSRRRLTGISLNRIRAADLKDLLPSASALTGENSLQLLTSGALTAGAMGSGEAYPDLPVDINVQLPAQAGGGTVGETSPNVRMMIRSFLMMLTQVQRRQANEHLSALKAIFSGLGSAEGRKAVVFFSSGFVVDATTEPELHRTISAANRAGVAVYPIDPQGLATGGTSSSLVPRGGLAYIGSAHQGVEAVGGESVFERARLAGSDATDSLLRYLAAETGGFAVRNTNDLYGGLARIKEEIESYYLLSYRPQKQSYDGVYRRLEVRSRNPALTVRHRPGYVALPKGYETLTSEEFQLLRAAGLGPASNWTIFVNADVFHPRQLGPNVLLTIDIPFNQLELRDDEASEDPKQRQGPLKTAAVYLVGLLRDSSGAVLQRFGEPVNLHLDAKRLAELRHGHLSFTFESMLLPGAYSFVVYAQDRNSPGNHALVERSLFVSPYTEEFQISSLLLGRHVERTRQTMLNAADGIKVSPSAERIFRPGERAVALFRVYDFELDGNSSCDLDVRFTLRRMGSEEAVRTHPFRLSEKCAQPADLPVTRYLELAGVPPGSYVLEASVEDRLTGSSVLSRTRLTVLSP
jgi:VWFA-related protein